MSLTIEERGVYTSLLEQACEDALRNAYKELLSEDSVLPNKAPIDKFKSTMRRAIRLKLQAIEALDDL